MMSTDPATQTTTYDRLLMKFISWGIIAVATLALKEDARSLSLTSANLLSASAVPLYVRTTSWP